MNHLFNASDPLNCCEEPSLIISLIFEIRQNHRFQRVFTLQNSAKIENMNVIVRLILIRSLKFPKRSDTFYAHLNTFELIPKSKESLSSILHAGWMINSPVIWTSLKRG
jgi:hypothetical protein